MKLSVAGLLVGAVLALPTAAVGAWLDTATVASGELRAATVAAPTLTCRTGVVGYVIFEWNAVPGASSYTFYAYEGAPGERLEVTHKEQVALLNGGTATVVANREFDSTTWRSPRSNGVPYGGVIVAGC